MSHKIYLPILIIMLILPMLLEATIRGGLEFAYDNVQVQGIGGTSYLSFDVMVKGNSLGDRLGTGIVLINYNPEVFGYRVKTQNNLVVSKGSLIIGNPISYYNLYIADNLPSRLAVTFEYFFPTGNGSIVPSEFQQLLNIKIKIQSYNLTTGISFYATGMNQQQYLDDNATNFSPVISNATIPELIPMVPQISSVSYQNAQITLLWQEMPNCTYSILSALEPNSNIWTTEAENLSTCSWTGPISYSKRFFTVTAHSSAIYMNKEK